MTLHGDFGKVAATYEESHFEWKINSRIIIEDETFEYCESPSFSFGGASWLFQLWGKSKSKPECMSLCLNTTNQREYLVEYNLSFKRSDRKREQLVTGILRENQMHNSCFVKRSKMFTGNSEAIIILCTLKRGTFLSTEPQVINNPKTKAIIDDGIIYEDYQKVFLDGQNQDLILKIGGKEFLVHRDILRIRSSAFDAMLNHSVEEKDNETIDVHDCDSEIMEQLLLYVYSGKVGTLNENNMIGLYYAANKYNMINLKEECCIFIKQSLSPSNICDVIQFALSHSDSDLLENATEYFCDNSQKIVRTVEWQSFLKDNSTTANELLIKSFDKFANAKT